MPPIENPKIPLHVSGAIMADSASFMIFGDLRISFTPRLSRFRTTVSVMCRAQKADRAGHNGGVFTVLSGERAADRSHGVSAAPQDLPGCPRRRVASGPR